jgi:hypothetical protein
MPEPIELKSQANSSQAGASNTKAAPSGTELEGKFKFNQCLAELETLLKNSFPSKKEEEKSVDVQMILEVKSELCEKEESATEAEIEVIELNNPECVEHILTETQLIDP